MSSEDVLAELRRRKDEGVGPWTVPSSAPGKEHLCRDGEIRVENGVHRQPREGDWYLNPWGEPTLSKFTQGGEFCPEFPILVARAVLHALQEGASDER